MSSVPKKRTRWKPRQKQANVLARIWLDDVTRCYITGQKRRDEVSNHEGMETKKQRRMRWYKKKKKSGKEKRKKKKGEASLEKESQRTTSASGRAELTGVGIRDSGVDAEKSKAPMHKCTHSSWHHTTLPHHRLLFLCNFSSFVSLSPSLCGAPLLHCSIFLKSLRTSIVSSCSKSSHRGSSVTGFFFLFFFFFFLSFSLSVFFLLLIL